MNEHEHYLNPIDFDEFLENNDDFFALQYETNNVDLEDVKDMIQGFRKVNSSVSDFRYTCKCFMFLTKWIFAYPTEEAKMVHDILDKEYEKVYGEELIIPDGTTGYESDADELSVMTDIAGTACKCPFWD